MVRCVVWMLVAACASLAQVAQEANAGYATSESRIAVAGVLDSEKRLEWDKPEKIVKILGLTPGATVADIGTGTGFLLPYLSKAVGPAGRVLAQDIFSDFLVRAKRRAKAGGLSNVQFILGTAKEPNLPQGVVDYALLLDTYHHLDYPEPVLAGIRRALRKQGRLIILDFYRRAGGMRLGNALEHIRANQPEVIAEVEMAGFHLVSRRDVMPNRRYLLIFEHQPKPSSGPEDLRRKR